MSGTVLTVVATEGDTPIGVLLKVWTAARMLKPDVKDGVHWAHDYAAAAMPRAQVESKALDFWVVVDDYIHEVNIAIQSTGMMFGWTVDGMQVVLATREYFMPGATTV